jgi:hypothetical protein
VWILNVKLATFAANYWQLQSGEEMHWDHPDTFWIPPANARATLQRGNAAKLLFEIEAYLEDGSVGVQGERMWVIVAERLGDTYIGILDNQPACLDKSERVYLCFGAEIPFRAEHVIDIAQPPPEYVEWQLGQPPERKWPRT